MTKFEEMGFNPGILRAIAELGFVEPMAVQQKVIPLMLGGDSDIIALAQTGTGKTAAFGLPLVEATDTTTESVQAIILCPTRELCMQITNDLTDYSKYTGKLKILAVYGGASIDNQIKALKKGVHIIVATPGRLIDLINRRAAKLGTVKTVILDEADEMLNMGFLDSINEILESVPSAHRTLLFSATMPAEIAAIAGNYMNNPVEVIVGRKNSSAENVAHYYYLVNSRDKYKVLKRLADSEPDIYAIVFCRTRAETQEVASKLIADMYNADALHGDLSQAQRDTVMQKFRVRSLQILVATDVAARGLDVDDLTHVINYTLPEDNEVYNHRSGRTGRAGKKGICISLATPKDRHSISQIEKKIRRNFSQLTIPTGSEICSRQLLHWVKKLETIETEHIEIEKVMPEINDRLGDLSREDLLRRIVSIEFDRFLGDYRFGEELFSPSENERGKPGKDGRKGERISEEGSVRFFINMGKVDGFYPEQLISLINSNVKGPKVPLGKIDLMKTFSFFEAGKEHSDEILNALNKAKFNERRVKVEIAQPRQEEGREKRGRDSRDSRGGRDDRGRDDRGRDDRDKKWKKKKKRG